MNMEKEITSPSAENMVHQDFFSNRRKTLRSILTFLGALGLGHFFYSSYKFLAPGSGGAKEKEIPLGEIPPGGAYFFKLGNTPGIIIHEEEGNLKAFSLVCTHMACIISWHPEKKEFFCPCHDGYFDSEGKVISGPPPAPLERWAAEVKEDRVLIKMA